MSSTTQVTLFSLLTAALLVLTGPGLLRRMGLGNPFLWRARETRNVTTRGTPTYSPTLVSAGFDQGPYLSGELVFSEEFDTLNLTLWNPVVTMSGCGSGEFQIYDKDSGSVFVKDGLLHISPKLTADKYGEAMLYNGTLDLPGCNDPLFSGCKKTAGDGAILNPVISARLRTIGNFAFVYGKVEVKAKIPRGDWLWPAIWLNPAKPAYGMWPMSGEIDMMESRGNDRYYDPAGRHMGNQWIGSCLHFGTNRTTDQWRKTHAQQWNSEGYYAKFHLFQLEWTPTFLKFKVDDVVIGIVEPPADGGFYALGGFQGENVWKNATRNARMAPFDDFMYVILNVAVGGTMGFFHDSHINMP